MSGKMVDPKNNLILSVNDLSIAFGKKQIPVVRNISFTIEKGACVGLVGESGSGKSLTSLAIMGLLPKGGRISSGNILFGQKKTDLTTLPQKEFQHLRGKDVAMIFQEPMTSLNPFLRCGEQVKEAMKLHHVGNKQEQKERVIQLFNEVKLPLPEAIYRRYPHQLSGGQRQRVMIALALSCNPQLLIADEPTTALDVSVQKEIIELLRNIQKKRELSILFISHDLALVQSIADQLIVLYRGDVVEKGQAREVFLSPSNSYTKGLVACRPSGKLRQFPLPTVSDFIEGHTPEVHIETAEERLIRHNALYSQKPILEVKGLSVSYNQKSSIFSSLKLFKAVDSVSFQLFPGETLGLVGESGCGKSTLGKAIMQLTENISGSVTYHGQEMTTLNTSHLRQIRRNIQFIFQDPFSSLNPRLTVGECVVEPMYVHNVYPSGRERWQKAGELFEQVGLSADFLSRYPHELSGGQRQRVAIARALSTCPEIVICDESVSALDVSVQAMVLNVLNNLKTTFGLTYIFISHDLGVIRYMSDRIMVMQKGQLVEFNEADKLFGEPLQSYTKHLLESVPGGK
jgi:peptide/nickel transport system ATP-binding protein